MAMIHHYFFLSSKNTLIPIRLTKLTYRIGQILPVNSFDERRN